MLGYMNMNPSLVMTVFGIFSLLVFFRGLREVANKDRAFSNTRLLFWMGIFVWGDAVIIGLFWSLVSLTCILLDDWILFALIGSVFWIVRSLGETIYWIHQQYAPMIRNHPKDMVGFHLFKNDSIWFVYQIAWQCIMVVSIVMTIYLADKWL